MASLTYVRRRNGLQPTTSYFIKRLIILLNLTFLFAVLQPPAPPSSAAHDSRLVFERSCNRLHSWVYILSLWKDGIKSKCQILLQPKMFLFKQKLGNKMTKTCACILIFNSTFLQSDPEILYATNTILTHLSFFYYYYYSALRNSKESTS